MGVSAAAVYGLVPAVATVLAAALAVVAWGRRPAPGATPFTGVFLAVMVWSFAYTMELIHADPASTLFWGKASYLGLSFLAPAWFLFSLDYTGTADWDSPLLLAALSVEPIVANALVWSYPATTLVWTETTPHPFGDILVMSYAYGPAFWANAIYAYGLLLAGVFLIVRRAIRIPSWDRRRVGAVVLGALVPWTGNLLFNAGLSPTPPLNVTHVGFVISGGLFFWAFYYGQLLDPKRAVRDRLFESIDVGIVLLDVDDVVEDMNPAAGEILGTTPADAVGKPLDALLPPGRSIFATDGEALFAETIALPGSDGPREYDVEVSSMYYTHQQRRAGRIVFLRG